MIVLSFIASFSRTEWLPPCVKRKERPPKDSRPKEKRFRHGGRKGRRARDRPNRAHK